MPIIDKTDYRAVDDAFERHIRRAEQALIRTLKYCGEVVINSARDAHTYKDQTGNLTSSIGAVISVDGKVIWKSSFEVVMKGGKGAKEGVAFAKELTGNYPKGIALICVAGKNYAAYVSHRGYDVLDTAQLTASQIVPQMLQSLEL